MSEPTTTLTGIKIEDCVTCGRRHPVTRTHCSQFGAPSLFSHDVHGSMDARVDFMQSVAHPYGPRPRSTAPGFPVVVTSLAEALSAAWEAFAAKYGTDPTDHITSDRNGWVTIEAYGPGYAPVVRVVYRP